jgi:LysR family transcriptional regulator, regulator for metE and metH
MKSLHDLVRGAVKPLRGGEGGGGASRPPQLEVRHLRLVQAVAAEGGVTRASRRLHLSQSAVSHQLIDLERSLGARLFDRVGKRMVATAAGRRVALAAERVLAELVTTERDLSARPNARRVLRIATGCYTSYHWLPPVLARFAGEQTGVDSRARWR